MRSASSREYGVRFLGTAEFGRNTSWCKGRIVVFFSCLQCQARRTCIPRRCGIIHFFVSFYETDVALTIPSLFGPHPPSRYHVTTADGQNFTAAKLILCPGAWGNDLLAHFDLKLDMQVCPSGLFASETHQASTIGRQVLNSAILEQVQLVFVVR